MKAVFNMRLSSDVRQKLQTEYYNGKANGQWKSWDDFVKHLLNIKTGISI